MLIMYKKRNDPKTCSCGKIAYTIEHGQPQCFGMWITWGCYYTEKMVNYDRKFYFQEKKHRENYNAMPLENKDRKKMIKHIEEMQEREYSFISRIPHDELVKWHDEKLKTEVRNLESVRSTNV